MVAINITLLYIFYLFLNELIKILRQKKRQARKGVWKMAPLKRKQLSLIKLRIAYFNLISEMEGLVIFRGKPIAVLVEFKWIWLLFIVLCENSMLDIKLI